MPKRKMIVFGLAVSLIAGFLLTFSAPQKASAEFGDKVMNRYASKAGIAPVVFPHWFHRVRVQCRVCHPSVFQMQAGANDVDMQKILSGEFCGKCHNGKVAWAPIYCDKCHSGKMGIDPAVLLQQGQTPSPNVVNPPAAAAGIPAAAPPAAPAPAKAAPKKK
ncbi:MAG: hypothetical protein OEV28_05140 [Nitrospirota bacterium]|nr:hypothetical protein [Nitrospirota bacterium]